MGFGLGSIVESITETVTGSEELGDILGGAADLATGNYAGALEAGLDLFEDAPGIGELHDLYSKGLAMYQGYGALGEKALGLAGYSVEVEWNPSEVLEFNKKLWG